MLHILLGKDWTANQEAILQRIASDVHTRKAGRVLIVPELISHEAERALCMAAGDTSSRYAEVLSFSRLSRRAALAAGSNALECMDNGGRLVAMAAAARQLSSRLKAYASVESKPEFLTDLIDAIDEFKRCCISPEDLKAAASATQGSLSQKLEELALLMEGYNALCAQGKRDPRDEMTWFLEQLECSTYGEEHVFYIDGFPDFTRQNMAVIKHFILVSPDVTISLNCDCAASSLLAFEKAGSTAQELIRFAKQNGIVYRIETIPDKKNPLQPVREQLYQGRISLGAARECLHTVQADTPWTETLSAANTILDLVHSGCRYRDISVVCTDMTVYQPMIQLIFHRMHIPIYQSGTEEILQKNMIATLLTAMEAALSNFDQRSVLRYLRSALSGIDQNDCDLLENYAYLWGIRGNQWVSQWDKHPDGLGKEWDAKSQQRLAELNQMRMTATAPLDHLRQGFQDARSLREQVLALYAFLEEIGLEQQLSQLAVQMDAAGDNRSAQILNQLWEILLSALEQLYDVLGDTQWESEHFVRLFRLLLSQYDVGTIPPVLDAVHIGPVTAMRCHQEQHLFVLGAQEGNLPGYSGSAGVLTDQERVTLRQIGVPLTGGAMEGIQEEFAEIYGVFCGAHRSIHVYCSGEPSFVFKRLKELSGGEEAANAALGFAAADAAEAGAWLAENSDCETAQRLQLSEPYQEIRNHADFQLGTITPEHIRLLYGSSLNLSASQVDRQAECRMTYFLNYGLKAKERKEATVDPAEFGSYVHSVLENTARCIQDLGGFHQVDLAQTLEIAHRFSDEYAQERFGQLQSQRASYLFRRNLRELDMVVDELWQELKEAQFEPRDYEVAFGYEGGLPPIVIPNKSIPAILRGYVDRVDVWKGPSSYYRVVDYKTGKKDFDYCDVFNGVGLQMLLYLFALRSSGAEMLGTKSFPAGVQYFPARVPYLTSDGMLDTEEVQEERQSHWKRKGLLLNDEAVLQAMEPGAQPKRLCCTVKKDGTLTGDLADRTQMQLLEGYVFRVLGNLVEDIASGNVAANPYSRGTSHSACRFCPYGAVCHGGAPEARRNYKRMTSKQFWEEVAKEMDSNG